LEKTIKIGEVEVHLKANARNLLIYRSAFGEDFMKAAGGLLKVFKPRLDENGEVVTIDEGQPLSDVDFTNLDGTGMMRIIWSMARTASNEIPPFDKWVDLFDAFPIMDILNDTYELIMVNMATISPIKNRSAAPKK
jgi:hypothetical protein